MKKVVIGLIVLALALSGYLIAVSSRGAQAAQSQPTPTAQEPVQADDTVIVEAAVKPVASVELRFPSSDLVGEVLVKEGETVKQGTPLARLDKRNLELALDKAKASLQQAQAQYDTLETGATPEEIAQAQAQVAQAQAQVQQAAGSVTNADIRSAQARLQSARTTLAELERGPQTAEVAAVKARLEQARVRLAEIEAGPKTADVSAARAKLAQAQAVLDQVRAGPNAADVQAARANLDAVKANRQARAASLSADKTRSQAAMLQAADDVRLAQSAFSSAFWDNEQAQNGQNPRTGNPFDHDGLDESTQQRQYQDALSQAEIKLSQAEQALAQAKVTYEEAQQAEVAGVAQADAQVQDAQAAYDKVLSSVDTPAIRAAEAQLAQAQAELDKLTRIDATAAASARADLAGAQADLDKLLRVNPSELAAARAAVVSAQAELQRLQGGEQSGRIAAAQAGVDNAQASLDQVTAGATAPDLSGALAQVKAAEVSVKEAELRLEQATLIAPMDGTVAEVNIKVGEVVPQEHSAVVLADFSRWQIETTDLTELNVVAIQEGTPVILTFDALPGVELAGTVTRIKPIGKDKQGDITYTAVIAPDGSGEQLRWNMTAAVVIKSAR